MINRQWQQTVGNIKSGIWMYTLGGIALGILGLFDSYFYFTDLLEGAYAAFSGDEDAYSYQLFDIEDYLEFLFNAMLLFGYYLFFSSIIKFAKLQRDDADRAAANKVKMSYVYLIIAIVLGWIPLIGWLLRLIFVIVSYVKLISGYGGLRRSQNLTEMARNGADTLRTAAIIMLIGGILGCLPLLGSFLESIFTLIAFFMVLSGWGSIKRGAPELTEEEARVAIEEENRMAAKLPEPKLQGYWILVIEAMACISAIVWLTYAYTLSEYDYLNPDTVELITLIIRMSLIAACVLILAYRKANVRGWSAFAVVMLIATHVGWLSSNAIINSICGEFYTQEHSMLSQSMDMFLSMIYFFAWLIFLLRSRLSNSFKIAGFILCCPFVWDILDSLTNMIVEYSNYDSYAAGFQAYQSYRLLFVLIEFSIIALLVWKNTKRVEPEKDIVIVIPDEQSRE